MKRVVVHIDRLVLNGIRPADQHAFAAGLQQELQRGFADRETVSQLIGSMGGSVESFYFAFGDADVYVVADLPSNEAASALALSINQSSVTKVKTVVLLTPEQVDEAARMTPDYRPPGS